MKGLQIEQIILLLIFVIVPIWRAVKNWLRQKTEQLAQQSHEVADTVDKTRPIEPLDPFTWPPPGESWPETAPVATVVPPAPTPRKTSKAASGRKAAPGPTASLASPSIASIASIDRGQVRWALGDAKRQQHAFALAVVLGPPRALEPPQTDP